MNMSSCVRPMRGVMTEVGGVMGVMAGDGPSDSRTSLSGLSNETSSVASMTGQTESDTVSACVIKLLCFHDRKLWMAPTEPLQSFLFFRYASELKHCGPLVGQSEHIYIYLTGPSE